MDGGGGVPTDQPLEKNSFEYVSQKKNEKWKFATQGVGV